MITPEATPTPEQVLLKEALAWTDGKEFCISHAVNVAKRLAAEVRRLQAWADELDKENDQLQSRVERAEDVALSATECEEDVAKSEASIAKLESERDGALANNAQLREAFDEARKDVEALGVGIELLIPSLASAESAKDLLVQLGETAQAIYDRMTAALAKPPADIHSDDIAVSRFAEAMKAKLAKKRAEGRGGWDDPTQCTVEYLADLLITHIAKGDPVDVANFAMMLHQRGAAYSVLADSGRELAGIKKDKDCFFETLQNIHEILCKLGFPVTSDLAFESRIKQMGSELGRLRELEKVVRTAYNNSEEVEVKDEHLAHIFSSEDVDNISGVLDEIEDASPSAGAESGVAK